MQTAYFNKINARIIDAQNSLIHGFMLLVCLQQSWCYGYSGLQRLNGQLHSIFIGNRLLYEWFIIIHLTTGSSENGIVTTTIVLIYLINWLFAILLTHTCHDLVLVQIGVNGWLQEICCLLWFEKPAYQTTSSLH